MVRPRPSTDACDFINLLVYTVTEYSQSKYDWVARSGKHSVFTLLSRLAPKVISMFLSTLPYADVAATPSSGS
jgi:hypothetical protein